MAISTWLRLYWIWLAEVHFPPPDADPNTGGRGLKPFNTVDYAPQLRAALVNLDAWVSLGVEPPPSEFPRLADGSAVTPESVRWRFESVEIGRGGRAQRAPSIGAAAVAE